MHYLCLAVAALAALTVTVSAQTTPLTGFDASAFCFDCATRRNVKDLYAFPTNCHEYVQCFYFNTTFALGVVRPCPVGTFFHDDILQCLPEGPVPCTDNCQTDSVSAHGCYANPTNCIDYFVCSNSASYQFCCPAGTRFDPTTCSCLLDATCTDTCPIAHVIAPVTPAPHLSDGGCIDSFGNLLEPVAGIPGDFILVGPNGVQFTLHCALGSDFNITSCRCDIPVAISPPQPSNKECYLWLPFDTNLEDQSIFKFITTDVGGASLDLTTSASGSGGSLATNGGWLEVPGLKTIDLGKAASWCLFFRCAGGVCTTGGLLSNNQDATRTLFSIIMATQNGNGATYQVSFWHPIGNTQFVTTTNAVNGAGWNQMCVVYDGTHTNLWINNVFVNAQPATGSVAIGHCPYVLGNDQFYGEFNGNIDNVLVCPHALSAAEINAHFTNNFAFLVNAGDIPA
jgi:hypothetical protein